MDDTGSMLVDKLIANYIEDDLNEMIMFELSDNYYVFQSMHHTTTSYMYVCMYVCMYVYTYSTCSYYKSCVIVLGSNSSKQIQLTGIIQI